MKILAKIRKFIVNGFIIGSITLLLFEILYRNAVIDFYKPEANALNSEALLNANDVDVLVFGDSFSATSEAINYVAKLRKQNPDITIVNFSVPGIGIRQVNTFAAQKIKQYNPKKIIYQIYVGNDLIDVNHFWNLEKFSLVRNIYWETTDHFLSLSYLNHKATYFKPKINERSVTMRTDEFIVDYYDIRTKRFLHGNSFYLDNTFSIKNDFKNRYDSWMHYMHDFLETIPKHVEVYLVWIPHCVQVNDYYLNNIKTLGATFKDEHKIKNVDYPFITAAKKDLNTFKNVTHLNPLAAFQQNDSLHYRLYFANDPHINNNGNEVLRDYLQSHIFN